jgi:alanine racemase
MESYLTAELSVSALVHNLRLLRSVLSGPCRLCAVVKADCYGHGSELLLPTISRHVDALGVATPEEAISLRRRDYNGPIYTFFSACAYNDGHELGEALETLITSHVTLTVVSPQEVAAVSQAADRVGAGANVHVKIDTGMSRSGVLPAHLRGVLDHIRRRPNVRLTGMYTHFATADEDDKDFTRRQLRAFMEAVSPHRTPGMVLHAANSAAAIDLPQTHLDMVRPGIAVYGYQPSEQMHTRLPLKPVMRLWGRLMQVKTVRAGSRCGYGLTHEFASDSRVGLVPVGYGDGYMRCLGRRHVTMRVRGRDVSVCGRVSMDQVVIDLSSVRDAQVGDEVEIMSPDPLAPHSVENLSRLADTIPYEITCRLGRRVRRVLVESFSDARYVPDRAVAMAGR